MKRWYFALISLIGLLALGACAAQEKALPQEGPAPAPAAPEAILPRKDAWQEEWDRVLAAAKGEGKVAVVGPLGSDIRKAMTEPFQKRYGIPVEFLGVAGPEYVARLRVEREAAQYLTDIYAGGATHILRAMKPMGAVDPIEPALILPEVKDTKNWRDEFFPIIDKDKKIIAFTAYSVTAFAINPNLVKPEEFKSWKDLLNPKWKGKMVWFDPRVPGAGQSRLQFYYMHKELGMDFIRALAKQEPVLTRDYREAANWLAQGKYPISISPHESIEDEMIRAGAPIHMLDAKQLKEGGYLAGGVGHLVLMNRAPHPNAAKLYINWLLSKEGQAEFSRGASTLSRRVDAPTDHLPPRVLPKAGFLDVTTEEAHLLREKVGEVAVEIFGR